jgi:hypothetical protein
MSESAPPSRLITMMGWIVLCIGLTAPLRLILEYAQIAPMLGFLGLTTRYRVSWILGLGIKLALGTLAFWSGWGIVRRRSWGPSATAVTGGAVLTDSLYYIVTMGPYLVGLILRTTNTKHAAMGLQLAAPLLIELIVAGCWFATLGAVLRPRGRSEFGEAPLPGSSLWACLVLSVLVCAALKALEWVFYWAQMPIQ